MSAYGCDVTVPAIAQLTVDGPSFDAYREQHGAAAMDEAGRALTAARDRIAPARDQDDLARVADAVIDCGDPGRDPGDEDDGAQVVEEIAVARMLFRAFDDMNIGREPLHDFDVMAECDYNGRRVIDNWRAAARAAIALGAHAPAAVLR